MSSRSYKTVTYCVEKTGPLIAALVNEWIRYEALAVEPMLASFCAWYLVQTFKPEKPAPDAGHLNQSLGELLEQLTRHRQQQASQMLCPTGVSWEESILLRKAYDMGSPRKSELIDRTQRTYSSGIDRVNQPISIGAFTQTQDETDKRANRIRLTDYGEQLRQQAEHCIEHLDEFVFRKLTPVEKQLS